MSSIANPLTSPAGTSPGTASTSSTTSTSSADPTDPLASESTFLTLLVSQLQNQDPTSPIDSTTFVSQLTSYSQLEQLIGIHSNTTTMAGADTPAGTPVTSFTPAATGTTTAGTTGTTPATTATGS